MKIDVCSVMGTLAFVGLALGQGAALAATKEYVAVAAGYERPKSQGDEGAIAVRFTPMEPRIVINENPAPRLKLQEGQKILEDRQPPRKPAGPPPDPANAKYLDPDVPVRFAVAPLPAAASGEHTVKADVTYFFCSKRENWCRKGTQEISIEVTIP